MNEGAHVHMVEKVHSLSDLAKLLNQINVPPFQFSMDIN